jgi:heat-inducible transcriptional repressor
MLDSRKLQVLRAIVEDYVATREPVASKTLVDRYRLGVSSATVRNDMAVLEDEGYITQPHTSAGRIPTDQGYRLFVDELMQVRELTPAETKAIDQMLEGAADVDEVMRRTVRLLSHLTKQVALVQYPSFSRSKVRHVDVISLSDSRLMVLVVTDTGRIEQRVIEVAEPISDAFISQVRARLLQVMPDKYFGDAARLLEGFEGQFAESQRKWVNAIVSEICSTLVERGDDRVALGGTANLARQGERFGLTLESLLEELEENVALLQLISESSTGVDRATFRVRIGKENALAGLESASVVTANYGRDEKSVSSLGVLGPTRMDYSETILVVQAVASYLSDYVKGAK